MSKKRGVSLEDKRKIVLSIYHDQVSPFNLKEIESIASRMGVVQQTIKDVNQSLVDDSLVLTDKIGSANFFWSFPSKQFEDLNRQKRSLENLYSEAEERISKLSAEMASLQQKRAKSESRDAKVAELQQLRQEEAALDAAIARSTSSVGGVSMDPAELHRIERQSASNAIAANRWTDNVFALKKFLCKKKGVSSKEADKLLRIPNGFDYIQ